MRYLFYIVIFMLLLTGGIVTLANLQEKEPAGDYIAKINGRYILESDLAKMRNVSLDSHAAKEEFINSMITREVLLQEALHRKIDQEEAFRLSIKNFYEQSLIKTLLDRQQEKLPRPPTEADVSAYLTLYNKRVRLSLQPVGPTSQETKEECQAETIESLFQNLAFPLRMNLLHLHAGDVSDRIDFMGCSYTIKLDTISSTGHNDPPENREKIAALIEEYNKEQLLRKWIAELVQKATIEVKAHKIEALR